MTPRSTPPFIEGSFETEKHRPFFLELGIEHTEFELLFPYEKEEEEDVDEIFMKAKREHQENEDSTTGEVDESFIKKMGL